MADVSISGVSDGLSLSESVTMSMASTTITHQSHRSIRTVKWEWTSAADGSVGGDLTEVIDGEILRVSHVPGTGGNQPTNNYDVTLLDDSGIDVLQGTGANISNAAPSDFFPALTNGTAGNSWATAIISKLNLIIAAAGATKSGAMTIYYR